MHPHTSSSLFCTTHCPTKNLLLSSFASANLFGSGKCKSQKIITTNGMRAKIISNSIFKTVSKHVPSWDRVSLHRISLPDVPAPLIPTLCSASVPSAVFTVSTSPPVSPLMPCTHLQVPIPTSMPDPPTFCLTVWTFSQFLFKKKWHLHCHDVSLISFMLSSQELFSLVQFVSFRERITEIMGWTCFSVWPDFSDLHRNRKMHSTLAL